MCSPHRLQYKIKGEINRVQIKILKIPMMGYSYLMHPSKMILGSQKSDHPFTRYRIWSLYIAWIPYVKVGPGDRLHFKTFP
jgi:hypothetical protein